MNLNLTLMLQTLLFLAASGVAVWWLVKFVIKSINKKP